MHANPDAGVNCDKYHAGLSNEQRKKTHHKFLRDELQVQVSVCLSVCLSVLLTYTHSCTHTNIYMYTVHCGNGSIRHGD